MSFEWFRFGFDFDIIIFVNIVLSSVADPANFVRIWILLFKSAMSGSGSGSGSGS
jgi:hypothetical protein